MFRYISQVLESITFLDILATIKTFSLAFIGMIAVTRDLMPKMEQKVLEKQQIQLL
jgi:hypothetical protein